MNRQSNTSIAKTGYDRSACAIGIVHLGFGAFHRAHQAVYIDDYMDKTGDLGWGVAAVNLRAEEAREFAALSSGDDGYLLKTTTPEGISAFRLVRPHIHFEDWSIDAQSAEELLSNPSVKAVSMTVTESGYYLNDDWLINADHPIIAAEINGGPKRSVYAYLAAALARRIAAIDAPITMLCCDNIRSNGDMLKRNFARYLELTGQHDIAEWCVTNATFPNAMVDRITPRSTQALHDEISAISSAHAPVAIHGEDFIQWVLQKDFADDFPALDKAGVELVDDVHPYEEAKIRILNGGHTALCYLGALAGYQTFDQAMADPKLRAHFDGFETENVLPGLTLDLPFDKAAYRDLIAARFSNAAIADDLGRICMDGWSKFPIFIRPTLRGCLAQGISPKWGYASIASWYVYARRFAQGQTHIPYVEPYWDHLEPFLAAGREADFARSEALWSSLPEDYPEFVPAIVQAIQDTESTWPI
ncbi:MAG: mannitol dehydrogenase family protein [Pseudomonadota bacterium]